MTAGTTERIQIYDATLRDGQHAVAHRLIDEQFAAYASAADDAGIPIIEVGHGNGLGASSLQAGRAAVPDQNMLDAVRASVKRGLVAAFLCPGWGTFNDIRRAAASGVDILRLGVHCTGVELAEGYAHEARSLGMQCHVVMMMSHLASPDELQHNAVKLVGYGCQAVGIMDSAGYMLPADVHARITAITQACAVPVSFHGHNNLSMAIENSLTAVRCGAHIIDACARGFGAGAGNTQLEVLCAVLERMGAATGIDLGRCLAAADVAERELIVTQPVIDSVSLVSGLAGVFSGFKRQVLSAASDYGVNPWDIFFELGRNGVVAGQEDLIIPTARALLDRQSSKAS